MENELPKRKPTRLKGFDYATVGAYFLTICVQHRKNILSSIVGGWLKYQATKEINCSRGTAGESIFQRSFYDHIIRNRQDYDEHLKYIYENPMYWYYDKLYAEE